MVAILDLRLARLLHRCVLHLHDWPNWCNLSHILPRGGKSLVRDLGLSMASLQPSSYGLYLVWCAVLDRRGVRDANDKVKLA